MYTDTKESAVSEVVGVILMVAITVIMAGIIAAYMFGLVNGGITPNRLISITAHQVSPSLIEVTYRGGYDTISLQNLTIIWPSGVEEFISSPKIGDVYQATNFAPPYNASSGDNDRVLVIGHFYHSESQIVLDTKV